MKVPLLNLNAQYEAIKPEIDQAVAEVFATQQFINGPQVGELEKAVAEYSGCTHGVGVSSGSDALLIALMAEEIGPGDEVITTPYTFFATAGAIARVGARPVFVDIDPATFNIDVNLIEGAVTDRTRAIIPVHLFGQMADMDPIMDIVHALNQKPKTKNQKPTIVIEDAAQAIGAEYKGRRAGSIGHYGTFSFFPSKNLGGAGDGGLVVCQDAERAERLRILRNHGSKPKYFHKFIGGNFRLDTLQAAVVLAKLKHLDAWTAVRQEHARVYRRLFEASGLTEKGLMLPAETMDRQIYNQFVIRCQDRDGLRRHLTDKGIGTEVYYPLPLHLQECFAYLGYSQGAFLQAELAAQESLALPIDPLLPADALEYVVSTINLKLETRNQQPK
ncbi:MAG: DegT/DnrJ/EryC1/StrS family aminotransferase [Desulfomicrobium sp.]|nr:DegT/DnrJ/EryC1/StrS family aminotransferase [Desulfomicrobium sp.]